MSQYSLFYLFIWGIVARNTFHLQLDAQGIFGIEVLRDLIKRQAKLIARQTMFHLARINGRTLRNCVHNTCYVYKVEALRMLDRLYCRNMKQS